jgi:hypothetical protein
MVVSDKKFGVVSYHREVDLWVFPKRMFVSPSPYRIAFTAFSERDFLIYSVLYVALYCG